MKEHYPILMHTDPLFSIEGKTILITGSGRGIGQTLAKAFLSRGARVILHGSDREKITALAKEWKCDSVIADLNQSTEIDVMLQSLHQKLETLDVILHNAGVEIIQPVAKMRLENFDHHMQVNLRSILQLNHGLLPLLKKSPAASIVHITSIHETVPYPHNACYGMTKAALAMLTKTLALEWAPFGIRVNNLAPGAVETDLNREIVHSMQNEFKEWIPLGRVAQPEEIIGPALFLASNASSYMTGSSLVIDGAYSQNLVRYRPNG